MLRHCDANLGLHLVLEVFRGGLRQQSGKGRRKLDLILGCQSGKEFLKPL